MYSFVYKEHGHALVFALQISRYDFQGTYSSDIIDVWKRKLTLLASNKDKQELISREKKDRRDYEQIAALATKLGLYRYFNLHKDWFLLSLMYF